MKEPVRTISKSYRSHCLYKLDKCTNKSTVYLLIQKSNSELVDSTCIKFLSSNSSSEFTYLPTVKPEIYLTNKSNIISDFIIDINQHLQIHVYLLGLIENLDIFNYKINWIQIPETYNTLLNIKNLFQMKKLYYQSKYKIRYVINVTHLEKLDKIMEVDDSDSIKSIMEISNINL
jgi:hypothetical protein